MRPAPRNNTSKRNTPRQPSASGRPSFAFALNHLVETGRFSKTIGPAKSNSATNPKANAPADIDSHRTPTETIKQRNNTIEFGMINHTRRPRRNERTMPKDIATGKLPSSKMPNRDINAPPLPRHSATMTPNTPTSDSATYVQAIASTILTGNGFLTSSIAPDLMCSRAASSCTVLYHKSP